jgi:hypothetical protein
MNNESTSVSNSTPEASAISARKAAANRANAQRSTGPRTTAGKARSSLNALRHGILARAAFNLKIEGPERRKEFEALVAGLAQEFQPQTMAEHLTVQQLAGCYWRLAKVWRYEQEAAWRMWISPGMPMEEFNEYDDADLPMVTMRHHVIDKAHQFLSEAGLNHPTIPNGASARTVLRYQATISSMLFRCLSILERRNKARETSEEAFEERDYLNEAGADASSSETEAPKPEVSSETPSPSAKQPEKHKRTQKAPADAALSPDGSAKNDAPEASKAPAQSGPSTS